MADYISRAKDIIASIKDKNQVRPNNNVLSQIVIAYVRNHSTMWKKLLSEYGYVINPNTNDITSVGYISDDNFVELNNRDTLSLYCFNFIRYIRGEIKGEMLTDWLNYGTVDANDVGKTAIEIKKKIRDNFMNLSKNELGDDDISVDTEN